MVNVRIAGSVDDPPTERSEQQRGRKKRGKDKRRGVKRGREGGGSWRKPSSYDTIDFLSEA